MNDPRYPIGKFVRPEKSTPQERAERIRQIAEAPAKLREAIRGLTPEQLAHPYREGGWTVRQVVHHVPDSHLNSYIRFKLAVTQEEPTINAYDEALWARLADADAAPVEPSLALLEALHSRWVIFLKSLSDEQFSRTYHHPEQGRVTLDQTLALYAWHGRHHVAHITSLRGRLGWR